jgi:hypothetical protein
LSTSGASPIPERRVLAERIAERSGGAVRPADMTFIEEG